MMDAIEVNGQKYVLATTAKNGVRESPVSIGNKKPVCVRALNAGVFVGYLKSRNGKEVVLQKARRIHYWDGAASLSELAMRGVSKPQNCRFPVEVDEVLLTGVFEILPMTLAAKKNIDAVPVWTK